MISSRSAVFISPSSANSTLEPVFLESFLASDTMSQFFSNHFFVNVQWLFRVSLGWFFISLWEKVFLLLLVSCGYFHFFLDCSNVPFCSFFQKIMFPKLFLCICNSAGEVSFELTVSSKPLSLISSGNKYISYWCISNIWEHEYRWNELIFWSIYCKDNHNISTLLWRGKLVHLFPYSAFEFLVVNTTEINFVCTEYFCRTKICSFPQFIYLKVKAEFWRLLDSAVINRKSSCHFIKSL